MGLAERIRQKYPGAYDDMADEDLVSAVLKKYPQYVDIASPQEKATVVVGRQVVGAVAGAKERAEAPQYSEDVGRFATTPALPSPRAAMTRSLATNAPEEDVSAQDIANVLSLHPAVLAATGGTSTAMSSRILPFLMRLGTGATLAKAGTGAITGATIAAPYAIPKAIRGDVEGAVGDVGKNAVIGAALASIPGAAGLVSRLIKLGVPAGQAGQIAREVAKEAVAAAPAVEAATAPTAAPLAAQAAAAAPAVEAAAAPTAAQMAAAAPAAEAAAAEAAAAPQFKVPPNVAQNPAVVRSPPVPENWPPAGTRVSTARLSPQELAEFQASTPPVQTGPASAQTLELMRRARDSGAKFGEKVWFVIKDGVPKVVSPAQAGAAKRAGEVTTFVNNVMGSSSAPSAATIQAAAAPVARTAAEVATPLVRAGTENVLNFNRLRQIMETSKANKKAVELLLREMFPGNWEEVMGQVASARTRL